MALREYAGAAKRTALTGDITASSTTLTVSDATGYPTGATGPFAVALDLGVAAEEKVLVTSRSGNTLTVSQRGYDGTTASAHGSGATVDHVLTATDIREANAHVNDSSGDPHPQYLTPAEGTVLYATAGHTHPAGAVTKTVRIPHTFTISGEVKVPSGDTSYIPPFFVPVPAGQTVTAFEAVHRLNSGSSATFTLRRVSIGGTTTNLVTGTSATTTTGSASLGNAALANNDRVELVVTAVSGTPTNMSVTVYLDYTV